MLKTFIRNWLFILIVILSNLFLSLRIPIRFFYYSFWFLISIVSFSLVWIFIEYFTVKLSLVRKVIGKINENEILEIKTILENRGFLPLFNLVFEDNLSCAFAGERKKRIVQDYLGSGSSAKISYQCECLQRGKYKIGPFSVYFFDPLNIFFLKKTYNVFSEVYVYPRTAGIKNFPSLSKGTLPWFGIETARTSGDEDEFYGIRDYKQGDQVKRIHWVSSARKNRLIVKQFQQHKFLRATLLFNLENDVNLGEGKENISEYIIRIAASVSKYLIGAGVSLEVIAHTEELVHIPSNRGSEHLEEILKFLTIAQAESRVSLAEVIEETARSIANDSTLIVIMKDKDWEHLSTILSLDKRNVSLVPLILISSTFLYTFDKREVVKDIAIKLSQVLNITPIIFSRGDNLGEIFLKYS